MNELFFPVVGAILVFLVAVPVLSIAARLLLMSSSNARNAIERHGNSLRFALIIGPVLAPVIWLVSAAWHQVEEGAPLTSCVIDHLGGAFCHDVVLFGALLFSIMGLGVMGRIDFSALLLRVMRLEKTDLRSLRVQHICQQNNQLAVFAHRVFAVEKGHAPVCTRGLFRPVIEISVDALGQLNDIELAAVLLHELAHAQKHDPLRFFIAQVALTLNPFARLLDADLARYSFAREALCDRHAVQLGADPLALARSIVAVAGPHPVPLFGAALSGHSVHGIKVRVHLLLDYAAEQPAPIAPAAPIGFLTLSALFLTLLPHTTGTGPLDALHNGIENVALLLGLA